MNYSDLDERLKELIDESIEQECEVNKEHFKLIMMTDYFDDLASAMEYVQTESTERRDFTIVQAALFFNFGDLEAMDEAKAEANKIIDLTIDSIIEDCKIERESDLENMEESDSDRLRDFNRLESSAINAEL